MSRTLAVHVPFQERDNWCWAAVSAGVRNFHFQEAVTQCQVAALALGNAGCCSDPRPCDVPNHLEFALQAVRCLAGLPIAGPLTFPQLVEQIEHLGRPVCAHYSWRNGGPQHFVAITGCSQQSGPTVVLQDPLRGVLTYDYSHALDQYEDEGVWDFTYLTHRQL